MVSIYLEKRIPTLNQQRFYRIHIIPTLWGSWAMVREWGRIGHPGTVRETGFESEEVALEAGMKLSQRKKKRGYRALAATKNTDNNPAQ
jgi:predicted DNA-binding WGR domain protein